MVTLAMALAVTLAMGSAPAKVSGEVEQRLDLRGDWKGEWWEPEQKILLAATRTFIDGSTCIVGQMNGYNLILPLSEITDTRDGRFSKYGFLGIYQQRSDRIFICFRAAEKGYPVSFYGNREQHLITLHRVKPRK